MQRRVRGLFDLLGIDLATAPASNVVFARSAQIDHLAPQLRRDWEDHCWSFHRAMIDALRPRAVVCMGNDAFWSVSSREPGVPVVKIRHTSRSRRTWAEEQAPIVRAALVAAANGT
jgi:uracil-DNA glycosylase